MADSTENGRNVSGNNDSTAASNEPLELSPFVFYAELDVYLISGSDEEEIEVTEDQKSFILSVLQQEQQHLQETLKLDSFGKVTEEYKIEIRVFSETEFNSIVKAIDEDYLKEKLIAFINIYVTDRAEFGDGRVCLNVNAVQAKTKRDAKSHFKKLVTSSGDSVKATATSEGKTENTRYVSDEFSSDSFVVIQEQDDDSVKSDDLFPKASDHCGQAEGSSTSVNKLFEVQTDQASDKLGESSNPCDEISNTAQDKTLCDEHESEVIETYEDAQSDIKAEQVTATSEGKTENTRYVSDEFSSDSFVVIQEQDDDSVIGDDLFPKASDHCGQAEGSSTSVNKLFEVQTDQASDKLGESSNPCDEISNTAQDKTSCDEHESEEIETYEDAQSDIKAEQVSASLIAHDNIKVETFNETLAEAIRPDFIDFIDHHKLLQHLDVLNPLNKTEIENVQHEKGHNEAANRMLQILMGKENWLDSLLVALRTRELAAHDVAEKFEIKRDEIRKRFSADDEDRFHDQRPQSSNVSETNMQFFVYIAADDNEKIGNVDLNFKRDEKVVLKRNMEKSAVEHVWQCVIGQDVCNFNYCYSYEVRTIKCQFHGHKYKGEDTKKSIDYKSDGRLIFNIESKDDSSLTEACSVFLRKIFSNVSAETQPVYLKAMRMLPLNKLKPADAANLMNNLNTISSMSTSGYILFTLLVGIIARGRPVQNAGINISSSRAKTMLESFKNVKKGDLDVAMQHTIENVVKEICRLAYSECGASVLKLMEFCYPALSFTFFSKLLEDTRTYNITLPVVDDEKVSYEENLHLFKTVCSCLSNSEDKLIWYVFRYCPLELSLSGMEAMDNEDIVNIVNSKLLEECCILAKQLNFVRMKHIFDRVPTRCGYTARFYKSVAGAVEVSFSNIKDTDLATEHASALMSMVALFEKKDFSNVVNTISLSKNKSLHDLFIQFLSLNCWRELADNCELYISQWFDRSAFFNHSKRNIHFHMHDLPFMYCCLDSLFQIDSVCSNQTVVCQLGDKARDAVLRNKPEEVFVGMFGVKTLKSNHAKELFKDHVNLFISSRTPADTATATLADFWDNQKVMSVDCRIHADVIMMVLDKTGLNSCDNHESGFMTIMKRWRFWINIFNLKGNNVSEIHKHPIVELAKNILVTVSDRMTSLTLECGFVKTIKESGYALIDNIQNIYEELQHILNLEDISKLISSWKRAQELLQETDDTFNMMHDVFQHLKLNACKVIPDLDNVLNDLMIIKNNYPKSPVCDLQNAAFWGIFQDITSVVPEIVTLTKSDIFWRVCQDIISDIADSSTSVVQSAEQELEVDQSHPIISEDTKPEQTDITITILKNFKSVGTEKYKSIWQPYFDAQNVNSQQMDDLIKCTSDLYKEIELAEFCLQKTLLDWVKIGLLMYTEHNTYEKRMLILKDVLDKFNIDISHDQNFSSALNLLMSFNEKELTFTLKDLYASKRCIEDVFDVIDEDVFAVLKELIQYPSLVDFLLEIVNEDIRKLINTVEEHSEHRLQASTVSNLIDVKNFIAAFCKEKVKKLSTKSIFETIYKSAKNIGCEHLIEIINDTSKHVSCLRSLFHNVANHVAVTREIINMLTIENSTAIVCFTMDLEGTCLVNMKCKNNDTEYVYSQTDISDHRSRAFLLMNTPTKKQTYAKNVTLNLTSSSYKTFIDYIDAALEIAMFFEQLHQTGHPDYVSSDFSTTLPVSQLKCKATEIKLKLQTWNDSLKASYMNYFWLCYFHPKQLWKIKQCLESKSQKEDFLKMIHFTGSQSDCFQIACELFCRGQKGEQDFGLPLLGKVLGEVLDSLLHPVILPHSRTFSQNNVVQDGHLWITCLEKDSSQVIPTLMAVYKDTIQAYPFPHQVLFCREDTTWEEINLLLQRCLKSSERKSKNKTLELYCIAMVENLPNMLQFLLVDEIKQHQWQSSRLALICRGRTGHPFLDYFSDYVSNITPMTPNEIQNCYEQHFPTVITITSEVPGLGKTTNIKNSAMSKKKKLKTLYISDHFNVKTVLSHLLDMKLTKDDILHISVELVNEPLDLEILLFQMIILKNVSYKSNFVFLETQDVFIELANTVNNHLVNTLFTTMLFHREHLEWKNFSNYIIPTNVESSVQVVCLYLDAMLTKKLPDKDLHFEGETAAEPLSEKRCQELLQKYFDLGYNNSFTLVNISLSVLAEQLMRMSRSTFFQVQQLRIMQAYQGRMIKQKMLEALMTVSNEFAKRSVKSCRSGQNMTVIQISGHVSADAVVDRVETGLLRWTDSNHLIITFNSYDQHTTSFVYRDLKDVPQDIKQLYLSQERKILPDLSKMSPSELQSMLQLITRKESEPITDNTSYYLQQYVLTLDNFLKMILISQRIDANIPVVMMGETGCGKTSVIRYLSLVCGTKMHIVNFHAGIDEKQILQEISCVSHEASSASEKSIWLFLDEINTSDHLGLITNIICHRNCYDVKLPKNVVVIAACNPYKLRTSDVFTSGLNAKAKMDEKSGLVYRVNPLPENLLDYVWDFGTLNKSDEYAYIHRMVTEVISEPKLELLVNLLVKSQHLIRKLEKNDYCVSLRDIDRCKKLIPWFSQMLKKKGKYSCDEIERNSVILSLAHTYHYRMSRKEDRRKYRNELQSVFKQFNVWQDCNIAAVISNEQEDLLNRMDFPEGIAKNSALKENVFVVLVCILNKLPVFLIGKPGCSKSLSLQLINDNLRGKDSVNPFFKTFPELYFFTYQGSEMSTSAGIIKVFDKAKSYKKSEKNEVLPVVILDEVGLAENSHFNPLKVLHSLLEPDNPQISVVGISNWALDAAKMNRVIHLCRPDLDAEELEETGIAISDATASEKCRVENNILKIVAHTFDQYIREATTLLPNFHGLRDFYSLVKYVSREISMQGSDSHCQDNLQSVFRGMQRNFGGYSSLLQSLVNIFKDQLQKMHMEVQLDELKHIPVLELIEDNIKDKKARNLMLITDGDAVLNVVENLLEQNDRKFVTIYGSQFENDTGDEYTYRMLSEIILYMAQGIVLILKDLDQLYGSLYDMLNQNYTCMNQKNICRVALGPHDNPWCQVHEDFRCIVVINNAKLNITDPPFLNRFEKQNLRIVDILDSGQKKMVQVLEKWITELSTIENLTFKPKDLIPVYSDELVPSLVYYCSKKKTSTEDEVLEVCKHELIKVCTAEGIIRGGKSVWSKYNETEYTILLSYYFEYPVHSGLKFFLESALEKNKSGESDNNIIIFTHTNIHENVKNCIESECQIENLSTFKSEKELSSKLKTFWFDKHKKLLIIQSLPSVDEKKILHLKAIIERQRFDFLNSDQEVPCEKNVVIIVHLERTDDERLGFISFFSGWKLTVIDSLVQKDPTVVDMHEKSIFDLIKIKGSLKDTINSYLSWAFTCIQYSRNSRTLDNLSEITKTIQEMEPIMNCIEKIIWRWLENNKTLHDEKMWQIDVACEKHKLLEYSTFIDLLHEVVVSYIKHPLAAIVCKVEICNAWNRCSWQVNDQPCCQKLNAWTDHLTNEDVIDISNEPPPSGPQCYYGPNILLYLKHPFSKAFLHQIEKKVKKECTKHCSQIMISNERDFLSEEELHTVFDRYLNLVQQSAHAMFELTYANQHNDYFDDFCALLCSRGTVALDTAKKVDMLKRILVSLIPLSHESLPIFVTKLHITWWLNEPKLHAVQQLVDACLQVKLKKTEGYYNEFVKLIGSDEEPECNLSEHMGNIDDTWNRITEHVCQTLLQSSIDLKDCDDCISWQRNTSMVLTHADEVSALPLESHSLSLCNHFSTMIVLSTGISEQYVVQLGKQLINNKLTSKEMFDFILGFLKELKSKTEIQFEHVLQFYSCYICSCLEASPDTGIMEWVLDETVSTELLTNGDYYLFGPALHLATLINLGSDDGPNTLVDLIIDQKKIQNIPFFKKLDEVLKGPLAESSFPCICVDIFQHFIIDGEIKEEDFVLCWNMYISSNMCLAQVVAIAYIKYHFEQFSKSESQNILEKNVSKEVHSEDKMHDLQRLFIASTVAGNGVVTFNHMCKKNTFLKDNGQQLLKSLFELSPLKASQLDQDIIDLFAELPQDGQSLKKVINDSVTDGSKQMALFLYALEHFFFTQLLQPLSEDRKLRAKHICSTAAETNMCKNSLTFLRCLCCREDFNSPVFMNLSEETGEKEFQITSFLIHVICFCLTNCQDHIPLNWCTCLLQISAIDKLYLPAVTKADDTQLGCFPSLLSLKKVQFSECDCNFRSATMDNDSDGKMCTVCSQKIKSGNIVQKCLSLTQENKPTYKGYIPCEPSDNMLTTAGSLSPITFRFFHLLIHACFAGSLALQVIEKQELAEILNLEKDVDLDDYLKNHIITHWNVLRQLTTFGDAQLSKFLHILLHEMKFQLFQEQTSFGSLQTTQFHEVSICKMIDEMTTHRFLDLQKCTMSDGLDNILNEVKLDKDKFPLILRHALPPSVHNMKSEFMIHKKDKHHPFLALVFAKEIQLELLGCLLPLVKWNWFCFEKISYRRTRNELKRKLLLEFVDSDDQKEEVQGLFEKFKDSWKKLNSNEKLLKKYNEKLGNIPEMVMTSTVEDWIVTDRNSAFYQILIALKNMQNEFLEDALVISLTLKHPSLSFMKKTDKSAYLATLPIEEITAKDVVHINMDFSEQKLTETVLRFSQCCTSYGHGRNHYYDFYFIERQLADHILVKKPYLEVTTSFPMIVCLGDCLYRTVTPFEDIEAFVEQHEIKTDIKNKVLNLKAQSHSYLRIILEYLEIIFTLMKRSQLPKNETDCLAQYYITQWPMYFLQRMPPVEAFLKPIQLCFLTSLFEYVESLEADKAISFLQKKYTIPLNEELKSNLISVTENNELDLIERLLAALKRFAYRHIDVPGISTKDPLQSKILKNSALWPRDTQTLFPDGPRRLDIHPNLCVEHVRCTVQFLQEYIQKKKGQFDPDGTVIKSIKQRKLWTKKKIG